MEILIQNEQTLPVKRNRLRQTVRKLLRAEGRSEKVEVSLLLTNDERIHKLNKDYRDMDRPTDVLSFSQGDVQETPCQVDEVIGDVVISVETAVRQAHALGRDPDDEMDMLLAHGVLHLLGYDDDTETGAEEMRRKVAAVLGAEIAR